MPRIFEEPILAFSSREDSIMNPNSDSAENFTLEITYPNFVFIWSAEKKTNRKLQKNENPNNRKNLKTRKFYSWHDLIWILFRYCVWEIKIKVKPHIMCSQVMSRVKRIWVILYDFCASFCFVNNFQQFSRHILIWFFWKCSVESECIYNCTLSLRTCGKCKKFGKIGIKIYASTILQFGSLTRIYIWDINNCSKNQRFFLFSAFFSLYSPVLWTSSDSAENFAWEEISWIFFAANVAWYIKKISKSRKKLKMQQNFKKFTIFNAKGWNIIFIL